MIKDTLHIITSKLASYLILLSHYLLSSFLFLIAEKEDFFSVCMFVVVVGWLGWGGEALLPGGFSLGYKITREKYKFHVSYKEIMI